MLRKDYSHKGSVEKEMYGRDPQESRRQDELIGDELPVVK
jgi:hypothetical protein